MSDTVHPSTLWSVAEFSPAFNRFDIHTKFWMLHNVKLKASLFQQGVGCLSLFNLIAGLFQVDLAFWVYNTDVCDLFGHCRTLLSPLYYHRKILADAHFTAGTRYSGRQGKLDVRNTSCHLSILRNHQGLIR